MTGTRMSRRCFEKGAVAAVVDREVEARGPVLRVDDSLRACRRWRAWARREWGGDVVAVTGSAGKTTTKDVIAEMLATGDHDGEDRRQPEQPRRAAAVAAAPGGRRRASRCSKWG